MIRYFLTRLRVEGFRGINNCGSPLDLRFRRDAVNSIWAPNGLGKSSIYEALCYAIRGSIPRLNDLEASERPDSYYLNVFHGGEASIELTLTPDDGGDDVVVRVTRSQNGTRTVGSPSGHPEPENLLRSLDQDHTLLDYAAFGKFLQDSALDRGRSFASLLGMAHLSNVRRALQQLCNAGNLERDFGFALLQAEIRRLEQQHQDAVSQVRITYQGLLGRLPSEPLQPTVIVDEATAALAAVPLLANTFAGRTLADVSFDDIAATIQSAERSEDQARLAGLFAAIARLESLADFAAANADVARLQELLVERDGALAGTRGPLFQQMFAAVNEVLQSGLWERPELCPACESEPATSPREYVTQQLRAFSDAASADERLETLWSNSACSRRLRDLEGSPDLAVPEAERSHGTVTAAFTTHAATQAELRTVQERLSALGLLRTEAVTRLAAERDRLRRELPASLVTLAEQVALGRRLRDALVSYVDGLRSDGPLMTARRRLAKRLQWGVFITQAAGAFEQAETAYSRLQTEELKASYQAMYRTVVAGEEVLPLLEKNSQTERVELRLSQFFDRHDLSARALLSESYRNALGISVFLSAALSRSVPSRFMVLDDITSSFDGGHQWHLMELLRTQVALPHNRSGLQLIILSHDGLLEKYFDRLSSEEGWQHVRLHGFSPTGNVLSDPQEANRLRADAERFLAAGQVRQAEPLVRQYLEMSLQRLITKVNIPVPIDFVIRNDRQMVQNCIDAIRDAVELHGRAGTLVLEPQQVTDLTRTHMPAIVANWVAHYGTGSATSVSPPAMRGVLNSIDRLSGCFQCVEPASGALRFYRGLDRR